ncbi:MAG: amidase [Acidimicrobiales bacterium]
MTTSSTSSTPSATGSPPAGSIARRSFAEARGHLAGRSLADPRVGLAVRFEPEDRAAAAPVAAGDDERRAGSGSSGRGPIHAARSAQAQGELTARDLVEQSLAAIAARDGDLHAIVAIDPDAVRRDADRCDRRREAGEALGLLHGIPITVKDVIDVAGLPTRAGSLAYHDEPPRDAAGVELLRAAGAVILAKTSTHEFALGVTNPQSRNPHDPTRIPGGSSGGSAIAVATGMGLASLGTDTRASIRVPAALSGTVGFKPTFGTVPTLGVVTLSWTMDHVAPMAASVADAALVLDALRGAREPALALAAGRSVSGLRVGLPASAWQGAEPDVVAAVDEAIASLAGAGAVLSACPALLPGHLDDANAAGLVISRCEAATAHRTLGTDLNRCWPEVAEQLEEALAVSAVDYLDAQRVRAELMTEVGALFDRHDVLAMPTVPVVAPPADDFARYLMVLARTAIPWSLVGFPAISVPCGTDARGLPIGVQLVAPPHHEATLVAVAAALESSLA